MVIGFKKVRDEKIDQVKTESGIYRNLTICHSPFPRYPPLPPGAAQNQCALWFFSRGLIKTLIPYLKFSLVILLQYTSNQMQASNKAEARGCSEELSATKIPAPNTLFCLTAIWGLISNPEKATRDLETGG